MYRAILFAVSWVVPAEQREAWLAEWLAELCYVCRCRGRAMRFCMGSFQDAYWLRKDGPGEDMLRLDSPGWCMALLAGLAIATLTAAVATAAHRAPGGCYSFDCMPASEARVMVIQYPLTALLCACLVLPVTTGVSLGGIGKAPGWYRRWLFLGGKVALVLVTMFAISLGAVQLRSVAAIMTLLNAVVFGGIRVFRWVLLDQQARCPVCLRLLDKPIEVGQASRCLINSEGTELVCLRGHGFLHVPGMTVSWRGTQTWHYLDASWDGLFSRQ